MKILIWWDQLQTGGVSSHMSNLLTAWPNKSDQFVIVYNKKNPSFIRVSQKLQDNVNVNFVPFFSFNDFFSKKFLVLIEFFLFPFYFIAVLVNCFLKLRNFSDCDVILANNGSYPGAWSALAALIASKYCGIKRRILLVHHRATPFRLGLEFIEKIIDRITLSATTLIIAVSNATRCTLVSTRGFNTEEYPIHIIHNGVSLVMESYSDDQDASGAIRSLLGLSENVILIGMMSRVEQYKGHEDLLIGFSEIPDRMKKDFHIVFIGEDDPTNKKHLISTANELNIVDHITFMGYVEGSPGHLISQLNLLLMITRDFEGFGLTVAEAMSVGTPVVCTKVGGIEEYVDTSCAYLIPPASPSSIADALISYHSNPEIFYNNAENAKKRIAKFSSLRMAIEFRRLILISQPPTKC